LHSGFSAAYSVTLALPDAGIWTLEIDSRYCETRMEPLRVTVLEKPS